MIKIGIIQASSLIGDIQYNLTKAVKMIEDISKKNAQIVCLPELFITGYDMDNKEIYSKDLIEKTKDLIEKEFSRIAKENKIYIIVPTVTFKSGKKLNSAILFDNKGIIIGNYDKTHLFEKERKVFDRGESIDVWDTEIGKIGIMICYDAGLPEVARVLKLKGAKIVFCPSAWRIQDKEIWDLNIKQRAIENRMFVVGVNSVTKTDKLHLFGSSKVVSPEGEIVCEVEVDKEEGIVCDVAIEKVDEYNDKNDYIIDRRPELYSIICR